MSNCVDCQAAFKAPYAKYCPACRWRHRGKPPKYRWTPEREAYLRTHYESRAGVSQRIGTLFGWPAWVIRRKARELGLSRPTWATTRQPWTAGELAFLDLHLGRRVPGWIAKQLDRSLTSVVVKIKRLGASRTLSDYYTARSVAQGFGCDEHAVTRWIQLGKLKAKPAPYADRTDGRIVAYQITPDDLRAFVQAHPSAYRLDRVDQLWFLDLVFKGSLGAEKKESAA